MTLVSIVVPAYNAAATLRETLDSACAQTWSDLEIIVVDDGSTDATPEIAAAKAAADPRVRLLRQANAGFCASRNAGVQAARGDYVAPLDSDDLMHPRRIAAQMARMTELGPQGGYVYTLSRGIDQHGRVVDDRGHPGFDGCVFLRSVICNFVGNGSALLVRREALTEIGGYAPQLTRLGSEDWHLQCMIARRWTVGCVPEMLTGYRLRANSVSMNLERMRQSELIAVEMTISQTPGTPVRVANVARAWALARSAAILARIGHPIAAARQFGRALALSPAAALETMIIDEVWRLTRKAAGRATQRLGLAGATPDRPHFYEINPSESIGGRPRLTFAALLARLEKDEAAFFAACAARERAKPAA
jgi:hypothetical protein